MHRKTGTVYCSLNTFILYDCYFAGKVTFVNKFGSLCVCFFQYLVYTVYTGLSVTIF